jgi:hypothetical protein
MAIAGSLPVAQRQSAAPSRPRFQYPLLRAGQYQFQLLSITDYVDERFGKDAYGKVRLRFRFVLLVPGADAVINGTKAEQEAMMLKHHGRFYDVEVHPVCSPATRKRDDSIQQASNLYLLLSILVNDGEDLRPEQYGQNASEATLKAFAAENGISLAEAKVAYPGHVLAELLNNVEASKPQVFATLAQKVNGKGEKVNKIKEVVSLVQEDDRLPDYVPFSMPRDPREASDDPDLHCEECGRQLRGYERSNDKVWVSNTEAAAQSAERYGKPMCGKCIKAAKTAADPGF